MDTTTQKTMVNSKPEAGEMKGKTVEVAKDIPSNSLEGMLGADAYAEFPDSTTMNFVTYENRRESLVEALGNRDSAKG